jgi:glycosyltransferase involved in cell wall biosynthesis
MSAVRYSQLFIERGHASVCVCPKDSPLAESASKNSLPMESVRLSKRIWPFGTSLMLRKILREQKTDVVFVHHLKDLIYLLPALIGLHKIRLVGLSHVLVSRSKKDPLHKFLYSFLSKMIVFTPVQRDLSLPVLPVQPDRYTVIPGFVDTGIFNRTKRSADLRASWGIEPGEAVIGTIGRLDEQKGQAELIEALSIVKTRAPELRWKAVLIGAVTASEEKKGYSLYVQRLVEEFRLKDRIQFFGFLPDPSAAMASLDLFVLPSYKETFGLVILEAMASGVVPLVTDAGGPPDIIGDTGIKFPPKDKETLATTLIHILKNENERRELADRAFERAQSVYSRNVVSNQLEALLKEFETR